MEIVIKKKCSIKALTSKCASEVVFNLIDTFWAHLLHSHNGRQYTALIIFELKLMWQELIIIQVYRDIPNCRKHWAIEWRYQWHAHYMDTGAIDQESGPLASSSSSLKNNQLETKALVDHPMKPCFVNVHD